MTDDEIRDRADANYFAMHAMFGTRHPRGEMRAAGGVLCAFSGEDVAQFNVIVVTRPLSDPLAQLRDAVAWMDARGLSFVARVRDGLDPAAERALEDLGLPYGDSVPGMALVDLSAGAAKPPGLEIRIGRTAAELDEHRRIAAESFGMPLDLADRLFPDDLMRSCDVEAYVGYVEDQPVATSVLLAFERVAGVYSVGTLASHRGRGFGEAMTWQAVRRGREMGCVLSALQASDMGRPVYERMGYRLVSQYRTYHR